MAKTIFSLEELNYAIGKIRTFNDSLFTKTGLSGMTIKNKLIPFVSTLEKDIVIKTIIDNSISNSFEKDLSIQEILEKYLDETIGLGKRRTISLPIDLATRIHVCWTISKQAIIEPHSSFTMKIMGRVYVNNFSIAWENFIGEFPSVLYDDIYNSLLEFIKDAEKNTEKKETTITNINNYINGTNVQTNINSSDSMQNVVPGIEDFIKLLKNKLPEINDEEFKEELSQKIKEYETEEDNPQKERKIKNWFRQNWDKISSIGISIGTALFDKLV